MCRDCLSSTKKPRSHSSRKLTIMRRPVCTYIPLLGTGTTLEILGARAGEQEMRVPGPVGHRPAVRARALSDRKIRKEAGHSDELPEGHQSLLHAGERRRQDG